MLPEHSFEKVGLLIRTPNFRRNRELFRQMELDDKAATATRIVGGLIRYLSGTELMGRKFGQRAENSQAAVDYHPATASRES
jgi:hypothetical protein